MFCEEENQWFPCKADHDFYSAYCENTWSPEHGFEIDCNEIIINEPTYKWRNAINTEAFYLACEALATREHMDELIRQRVEEFEIMLRHDLELWLLTNIHNRCLSPINLTKHPSEKCDA